MSLWLAKDQRSNEVVALQNALNLALQPAEPLVLDGIFGPLTDASVHEFQKCQGIKTDGIAGPRTLEALFKGVDVTVRISVMTMRAFADTRTAASPFQPPAQPHYPGRTKPATEISFGAMGVLHREALVRGWVHHEAPKPKLDLPPLTHRDLVIDRRAFSQKRGFSLYPELPRETKEVDGESFAEVEVALEPTAKVSKKVKKVELEFSYRVLLNRFKPWLVPGLSLLPTPDGRWQAKAELMLRPFPIFEREWKQWTFEMNPLLRATVTLPAFFGRNHASEVDFSAGLNTEIGRQVGPRGAKIFLGARMGILGTLELEQHRVAGQFKRPEGLFGLAVGARWF